MNLSLSDHLPSKPTVRQHNFIAALWHGAFLAMSVSITVATTVISSFVVDLTGSTIWMGSLASVLTAAGTLPQLFVARWVEPRPRKMLFLLMAIYLRVLSWSMWAFSIFVIGYCHPITLAWILVGMLVVFYAGGGAGNIPYTDIIGKVIPPGRHGAFFAGAALSPALLSIFFLMGATVAGRKVGFQSAFLELAPAAKRSTCAALNAVLILPVASLPLAAGLFLQHWSYKLQFGLTSAFIALGVIII